MRRAIHTRLSKRRRVAIPAELCEEYGLEAGAPVVLELSESGIVLRPLHAVIREVQAFFAEAAPPDLLLSDELSKDRRKDAEQENSDRSM
jgi:bifunctional DNA-binding transcriptional regulator/antitoxin component of YhaV-PrlF toxin-antitoxin module